MATPINMKFPMKMGPKGSFDTNDETLDAVESDLRMLLITNYGDRVIHYDYGTNLRPLVFEFVGDALAQAVKDRILSSVETWMPFVKIVNISVTDSTTNTQLNTNEIHVKIEFTVGNIDVTRVLIQRIKT